MGAPAARHLGAGGPGPLGAGGCPLPSLLPGKQALTEGCEYTLTRTHTSVHTSHTASFAHRTQGNALTRAQALHALVHTHTHTCVQRLSWGMHSPAHSRAHECSPAGPGRPPPAGVLPAQPPPPRHPVLTLPRPWGPQARPPGQQRPPSKPLPGAFGTSFLTVAGSWPLAQRPWTSHGA